MSCRQRLRQHYFEISQSTTSLEQDRDTVRASFVTSISHSLLFPYQLSLWLTHTSQNVGNRSADEPLDRRKWTKPDLSWSSPINTDGID